MARRSDAPALFGGGNEFRARVRRIRLVRRWDQPQLAEQAGISPGLVSGIETGKVTASTDQIQAIAAALRYRPEFLVREMRLTETTRPWLRAYADASKREADARRAFATLAMEYVRGLSLRPTPDLIPHFVGDLDDDHDVDDAAAELRQLAGIDSDSVVGDMIRAAESVGCVVLPFDSEMGRHLGMSVRADQLPLICVAKGGIPGDRQRFTVAHELGHLILHADAAPPRDSAAAAAMERQANRFAASFLAPGDAILESLHEIARGRVTLGGLADIKEIWGVSIKGLVGRFRELGEIDAAQAQSLYRQISSRKWTKVEPIEVPTEQGTWFGRAVSLDAHTESLTEACRTCADRLGGDAADLESMTSWHTRDADVVTLAGRRVSKPSSRGGRP